MVDLNKVISQRPQIFNRSKGIIKASSRHVDRITTGNSYAEDEAFSNVRVLYLGNNLVKSLRWASTFSSLKVLSLQNNMIASFRQVAYLRYCRRLRKVGLCGNPIGELPNYRANVVHRLPQITHLDSTLVEDRKVCASIVKEEKMAMALLMESACNVRLIAHIQKLFSMHEELCSLVLRYPSVSLGTEANDATRHKQPGGTERLRILLQHLSYPETLSQSEMLSIKEELLQSVVQCAKLYNKSQKLCHASTELPLSLWRKSYSRVEQQLRERLAKLLGECSTRKSVRKGEVSRKLLVFYAINQRTREQKGATGKTPTPGKPLKRETNNKRKKRRKGDKLTEATTMSEHLLQTATPIKLNCLK